MVSVNIVPAPGSTGNTSMPLTPVDAVPGSSQTWYLGGFPLKSPESLELVPYSRFRFTKVKIRYQPMVPSSQDGSFWFGYFPDSAIIDAGTISATTIQSLPFSCNTPLWCPSEIDITDGLETAQWFYLNPTGPFSGVVPDSDLRQFFQGAIVSTWQGIPSMLPLVSSVFGYFWLDYTLQAVEPGYGSNLISSSTGLMSNIVIGPKKSEASESKPSDVSSSDAKLESRSFAQVVQLSSLPRGEEAVSAPRQLF
jgi:hypothetical protein